MTRPVRHGLPARPLRPSDLLWKEGAGYYTESPEQIRLHPLLPDLSRLRDRRMADLFDRQAGLAPGSRVLEVGCGRSAWLPFLGRHHGCRVVGLDIEPFAAELARANLLGAGVEGEILCRDAFAPEANRDLLGRFDLVYSMGVMEHFEDVSARLAALGRYLGPAGRILTLVPNLRGVNWLLQRLGDLETLEMHVIYDAASLRRVHEVAGFRTLAVGYVGFYDAYLSRGSTSSGRLRRAIHAWLCRASGLASEAWIRLGRGSVTPEIPWCSPLVYYVGLSHRSLGGAHLAAPPITACW